MKFPNLYTDYYYQKLNNEQRVSLAIECAKRLIFFSAINGLAMDGRLLNLIVARTRHKYGLVDLFSVDAATVEANTVINEYRQHLSPEILASFVIIDIATELCNLLGSNNYTMIRPGVPYNESVYSRVASLVGNKEKKWQHDRIESMALESTL